ncbi:MAG: hypothetical protein VX017_10870, partial [Pseudomonadota bacterium]|nr:hypothetical protein [Pseudomonadota bacterium]
PDARAGTTTNLTVQAPFGRAGSGLLSVTAAGLVACVPFVLGADGTATVPLALERWHCPKLRIEALCCGSSLHEATAGGDGGGDGGGGEGGGGKGGGGEGSGGASGASVAPLSGGRVSPKSGTKCSPNPGRA